jgi:hypothetical protein
VLIVGSFSNRITSIKTTIVNEVSSQKDQLKAEQDKLNAEKAKKEEKNEQQKSKVCKG